METLIGKKLPDETITGLKGKIVFNGGSHCQIQLPNIFKPWQTQNNGKNDDTLLYDIDVPLATAGGVAKSHGKDSNNGKLPYSSHYLCQAALTNAGFTARNIERLLALEAKPIAVITAAALK